MSEAMQRQKAPMPAQLVFSGATIGIVGASVTKHADGIEKLIVALDSRADALNLAAAAPGPWGLGLLVVGAVMAMSGLVVAAGWPNPNMESPINRVREPRQNALISGPTCQTHTRVPSAGSVSAVRPGEVSRITEETRRAPGSAGIDGVPICWYWRSEGQPSGSSSHASRRPHVEQA